MKISVAMCTYNGAAFIREQLDSIAAQARRPDELIICDDRSDDTTLCIAEDFAAGAPFPVQVIANQRNLGSTPNFEKAISLSSGDAICLADQDDVWQPEKLAAIEAAFSHPDVGLVFSNAEMVDASLAPLGQSFWQSIGFDRSRQRLVEQGQALEVLLAQTVVGGATMAFRAAFKPLVLPIPATGPLIHDGWIALLIAAVSGIRIIDRPLIKYRQHAAQQMGARRIGNVKQVTLARKTESRDYLQQAEQFKQAYERLAVLDGPESLTENLGLIREKIAHLSTRASMPAQRVRRLSPVLKETLNSHYHRFSRGWFSAVRDLLV